MDHILQGVRVVGLSPTGRATVRVCSMNLPRRMRLRAKLQGRD